MQDSIFTKIIKGEIPCQKVYEDDKAIVIMDINPIQTGQVLVIPKTPTDHLWDLSDDDYKHTLMVSKRVAQQLRKVFPDKKRIALVVEGFEIPHAHIKIFPLNSGRELHDFPKNLEPNHAELAELAKKLAF